jgi:hypothetical protein
MSRILNPSKLQDNNEITLCALSHFDSSYNLKRLCFSLNLVLKYAVLVNSLSGRPSIIPITSVLVLCKLHAYISIPEHF